MFSEIQTKQSNEKGKMFIYSIEPLKEKYELVSQSSSFEIEQKQSNEALSTYLIY